MGILNLDMIKNYVLLGVFIGVHFSYTWSCFSSQQLMPCFLFQQSMSWVSVQLYHFKLNCPAFQFILVGKRGLWLFENSLKLSKIQMSSIIKTNLDYFTYRDYLCLWDIIFPDFSAQKVRVCIRHKNYIINFFSSNMAHPIQDKMTKKK